MMKPETSLFRDEVYNVVAAIPRGKVLTYGQIAILVGWPSHARMVGHVLHGAPPRLPCHRVVNAAGRLAPGWMEQRQLLEHEGVTFLKSGRVDIKHHQWNFMEAPLIDDTD